MSSLRVRPLAICLIYRNGATGRDLFVMEGFDPAKESWFYRPLGGGIEFGERGHETVKRKFLEETQENLTDVRFLGVLENIFSYAGTLGHELIMVYEGCFADENVYKLDSLSAYEDDGSSFTARWLPLTDFQSGKRRLVPEGPLATSPCQKLRRAKIHPPPSPDPRRNSRRIRPEL